VREVVFPDGAVYRGAMRGISLHGKGEYVSKAFKYQGEFLDGLKHGNGVYIWENGDRFDGTFAQDRPDGRGKYHFANGDSYEGEVKAGVIVGRGAYTTKAGDLFEGRSPMASRMASASTGSPTATATKARWTMGACRAAALHLEER
jgi:hypothetical protein